jgi:hypothetical protein
MRFLLRILERLAHHFLGSLHRRGSAGRRSSASKAEEEEEEEEEEEGVAPGSLPVK